MNLVRKPLLHALFVLVILAPLAAADFVVESAGAAPPDTPAAIREMLGPEGVRVKDGSGKVVAEYWARSAAFSAEPISGFGIRLDTVPESALIALVRFPEGGSDFREQNIPAGLYTLRYTLHPEDGNHMGVAASRDFGLLTPAAEDTAPTNNPDYKSLVELSKKVGNPHPTIVRVELPEGNESSHLWENDYGHQVLDLQVVNDTVGIVVFGHSEE